MAITQWASDNLPIRPGLYTNFVSAAISQIRGGVRGVVAIPLLLSIGGTASQKKMYKVDRETDAAALFGALNIQSIKFALQGGAKEVLVYTMPISPLAADYDAMRTAFEAYPFNVFVFDGEVSSSEQGKTLTWLQANRDERKHFFFVTGGASADDAVPATGNSRSTTLKDDYVINLVNGVTIDGTNYSSGKYASYIAGLVASTPINRSITFTQVKVNDVTLRYRNSDIKTALLAGSLVLVNDGEVVKIEQGLTTNKTKIRGISSRQQVSMDIEKTARDNYIGKLDNNEDGQAALLNAINAYLETLENNNVLTIPIGAGAILDPQIQSVGDSVFVVVSYDEVDSMERIFLSINI